MEGDTWHSFHRTNTHFKNIPFSFELVELNVSPRETGGRLKNYFLVPKELTR